MLFKDYLATFPDISHLAGLNVCDEQGVVLHTIPAIEGKLGSLKLYNALFAKFEGKLTALAAKQGLEWFAEHVEDAKLHAGKHPNIDLLLQIVEKNAVYTLQPIAK